jgi:hypothetical protein
VLVDLGADIEAVDEEGQDCLSIAVCNPVLVRMLLSRGANVTINVLFAAIDCRSVNTVDQLLSTGIDPNMRPDGTTEDLVEEEEEILWPSGISPLGFDTDMQQPECYALKQATSAIFGVSCYQSGSAELRENQVHQVKSLLAHGANRYTVFRQPIRRPMARDAVCYTYPGDDVGDVDVGTFCSSDNYDEEVDVRDRKPLSYGLRSIIHALLEDGGFVKPILEHPSLELEYRDPQGRTLLLSACRSALGADASIDSNLVDVSRNPSTGGYNRNPFSDPETFTPVQYLLCHGVDPMAHDNWGENALHQLPEAHDSVTQQSRPPIIRQTLRHIAAKFPALVNRQHGHVSAPCRAATLTPV